MSESAVRAPGPGMWTRETTHQARPYSTFHKAVFFPCFDAGMRQAFRDYGVLLDRIEMREVRGWMYMRPRPVGAPERPRKPPPRAVFKLLFLLHPELRRRKRAAARSLVERPWRADAERWHAELRDRFAAQAREFQAVNPEDLDDEALRGHLECVLGLLRAGLKLHFRHTVGHMAAVGDWAARTAEWTGTPPAEAVGALRGSSPWSLRPVETLDRLAGTVRRSPAAKRALDQKAPAEVVQAGLRSSSPEVAAALDAYLDEHGEDIVTGFQLEDRRLRELPSALVSILRGHLERGSPKPNGAADELALVLRAKVPGAVRPEYDRLLADAKLLYGLRDDDGRLTCGRPFGLTRRALLAAGERLASRGRLRAVDDIFQASPEEVDGLLTGAVSPSADELRRRSEERQVQAMDPPPAVLGDPEAPPPMEWFSPACARLNSAVMLALGLAEASGATPPDGSKPGELRGVPASGGRYEGVARIVCQPSEFSRLQAGDVLVAPITSAQYSVVLPLIGAVVTDRGGVLSHPAIVAREFGIPAVVGTGEATQRIADGAMVVVDGDRGVVTIL
jgi:phosphohistidine swiveling domain-containing protein